jgi:two-component system phosphate regulon sensor histidine kinase PhoR
MPGALTRAISLALLTACLALPVGLYTSASFGWTLFCLGLVLQMAFHFRNFTRLDRWSRAPGVDPTFEGDGAWDGIFARLYQHEKKLRNDIVQRDRELELLIAANQALNDGVVLLNRHHQILFCNTTAEAQLGIEAKRDRGQPIVNLVRQPEFVNYLLAGEFEMPLVVRLERRAEAVLSLHVMPYAGDRRLIQIKDITQSDRLDRMRRDFIANVSHELRTPLTVLAGFIETLRELPLSAEERDDYLGLMREQSQRMQSIVQDLLTLSTLESAPPPADQRIDMTSLLDRLRRDAEALSSGRHPITLERDDNLDLRGAEAELFSAFANLVSNAVRYTPAGGAVRIQWRRLDDGAEFAVQDSGIGIDAKHIPRLTERFYRVDRGRSRDSGGTGLGLAIVKHALNRHQAKLEITSHPGLGSRFAVRFPAPRVVGDPAAD